MKKPKAKKSPKEPKLTILQQGVQKYAHLVQTGTLLAIDPSSGSEGSMPGYSYYHQGKLKSYGVIELPAGADLHLRLQALCKCLMHSFPVPDVLVVENIAPYVNGNSRGVVNLHKGIGVILGSIQCPRLVEIAPVSWKKSLRDEGMETKYVKSDVNDAIYMGHVVVQDAFKFLGAQMPEFDFSILMRPNYSR